MSFNSLEEIRIFNQVVLSRGFSAAAEALQLPTNTVSRRVASLETQLGVRLLNRTTRSISLTAEGETLFARSVELLKAFDGLKKDLTKHQAEISGSIRIAVRTTTVEFGLLNHLKELLNEHQSLDIQLVVSDDPLDMIAEGIDLALVIGELPDSTLVAKKIGEVVFCLCAAKTYIADANTIRTPEDIVNYNYILPWQKKSTHRLILKKNSGEEIQVIPHSRFQSNDVRTRAAAVYTGLGIGALPLNEVEDKVRRGELVRILPDYTLPLFSVWCLKSREKKHDPRLRLIENILTSVVATMGSEKI